MIRINLLHVERTTPKRRASLQFSMPFSGQKATLLASLILVAALAYVGYRFWSLHIQQQQMQHELETAREEERKLQSVLRQVEEFEARKKQLQDRVLLIERLRKGQTAPVYLLEHISRSLPDRLWLTEMVQSNGYSVEMQGESSTLTSLADFLGNLENTGYFKRPVEILNSEEVKAQGKNDLDLIRFRIKAQFTMPGLEEEAPPPSTSRTARPRR